MFLDSILSSLVSVDQTSKNDDYKQHHNNYNNNNHNNYIIMWLSTKIMDTLLSYHYYPIIKSKKLLLINLFYIFIFRKHLPDTRVHGGSSIITWRCCFSFIILSILISGGLVLAFFIYNMHNQIYELKRKLGNFFLPYYTVVCYFVLILLLFFL